MTPVKLEELSVGTVLPELQRRVTQERINLYAAASGDYNPIHLDPDFARKSGLDGTIAHGMLVLAYISEFMTANFGQAWLTGGSLGARFKAPARSGDTITVNGRVTSVEKEAGYTLISCEVFCRNQPGEAVINCETKVKVKADENSR
jgi:3-hydroxybutyryl-CoA dehydratase